MSVITLTRFLLETRPGGEVVPSQLQTLIEAVADACKLIGNSIAKGGLTDVLGSLASKNVQGEVQQKLDVIANGIMLEANEWGGHLAAMASEEMEAISLVPDGYPKGDYLLLFDPIDGSSNIDVDLSVGTIFSVLKAPNDRSERVVTEMDFLQPGDKQVAAGYAIYGPQTILVLTLGAGVFEFTLDQEVGSWRLTHGPIAMPQSTPEFAINMSNRRQWSPAIVQYVEERVSGAEGVCARNYNMRWTASMVADVHRILKRGGVFMYPFDIREAKTAKLRLMYEANPMAFLIQQAGGSATNGNTEILSIQPTSLHERVGVILGDPAEVATITAYELSAAPAC